MFRRSEEERQEPIQAREVAIETGGSARDAERGTGGTSNEVTVVGQGARLEGTLISAGNLRIDGQIKGRINAEGDVTLSPQSRVEADIDAQNVTVAGGFKGNITVKGRAELAAGGRVEGNVTSKVLVVAEGATFHGQSIMGEAAAKGSDRSAGEARGATADASAGTAGSSGRPGSTGSEKPPA